MAKKVIAFDIDDVLAVESEFVLAYSNEYWPNLTTNDYREHWQEMWGVDITETRQRETILHQQGIETTYRLINGSATVLKKLTYDFQLVAASPRRKVVKNKTFKWLKADFDGVLDKVIFTNFWDDDLFGGPMRTKGAICQRIGANYSIDEQSKHCLAIAKFGIHATLFGGYPWWQSAGKLPKRAVNISET